MKFGYNRLNIRKLQYHMKEEIYGFCLPEYPVDLIIKFIHSNTLFRNKVLFVYKSHE